MEVAMADTSVEPTGPPEPAGVAGGSRVNCDECASIPSGAWRFRHGRHSDGRSSSIRSGSSFTRWIWS